MHINNPRTADFSDLVSYVTSDEMTPSQPRMTQVHWSSVVRVDAINQEIGEADGMVTALRDLPLEVRVADCGNIYVYDPEQWVIWVCHSGWRWSYLNIVQNLVAEMKNLWSELEHIRVWTGPCISVQNYEFWPEVVDLFNKKYIVRADKKYYLNIPLVLRDQFLEVWILEEHIKQSNICTFAGTDRPSYRRDGTWGRITGSIMMK